MRAGDPIGFPGHAAFSADRQSVTLRLTDGGAGDLDGVANGVIIDPSGPDALAGKENPAVTGGGRGGGCFVPAATRPEGAFDQLFWGFAVLLSTMVVVLKR